MTLSEKPRQFCMKSPLILIARGLSINNQKLVDLLFQPLTRKHEIRGDAFSKSLSVLTSPGNRFGNMSYARKTTTSTNCVFFLVFFFLFSFLYIVLTKTVEVLLIMRRLVIVSTVCLGPMGHQDNI